MVVGVEEGYKKNLEVNGVGYRAAVNDGILTLQLGYSHDIKLAIPNDLEVKCAKPTEIAIYGIDKQKVGQFASEIRSFRKPEPVAAPPYAAMIFPKLTDFDPFSVLIQLLFGKLTADS